MTDAFTAKLDGILKGMVDDTVEEMRTREPERYRRIGRVPFEKIVIEPRALTVAADEYAALTGDVDEIALGRVILTFLEASES